MCGIITPFSETSMKKKFVVDQKSLSAILESMQPICSKKTTLEATSSILFQVGQKELVLKSTDLELSLQSSCMLSESDFDETDSFLVSGKRIFEVVKELEGTITFFLEKNKLSLEAGDVNLTLHIKVAEEFPPFPERIENLMHLDAPLLYKMLDAVMFLIPQSNATAALNGLLFELSSKELKLTTTDAHCLAQVKTSKTTFHEPKTWLLPRRAIFELKKVLETTDDATLFLGTCGTQLVFSGELFNFFTKVLADRFPDYRSILSRESFKEATIEKARFIKTLRRSVCLLANQFIATKFAFANDNLRVSMENKEVGTQDEQLSFSGATKTTNMMIYAPYLLNGVTAFDTKELTFYLKSSTSPLIFESDDEEFSLTYVVMPVSPSMAG